jgi:hypothetical protein
MRIVPYSFDPSREQETQRSFNDQFISALRRAPGFGHYYVVGDRTTGRGYGISLWDTREQAEAVRTVLGSQMMQGMQALGVQFETSHVLEVIAEA